MRPSFARLLLSIARLRERVNRLLRAVYAKGELIHFRGAERVKQCRNDAGAVNLVADRKLRPIVASAKAARSWNPPLRCLVVLYQPDIECRVWRNVVIRRRIESRRGCLFMLRPAQLYWPPGPTVFGKGKVE